MGNLFIRPLLKPSETESKDECTAVEKSYVRKDLSLDANEPPEGDTRLHEAVRLINIDRVLETLDHSPDVNLSNRKGDTPLHLAAESGQKDVAEVLINHGAIVNARNCYDEMPLHAAAKFGCAELVSLLLDRGANINDRNSSPRKHDSSPGKKLNPLHLAVRYGHAEVITLLLNRGTDITTKDGHMRNPLHTAARHGQIQAMQILLEYVDTLQLTNQTINDDNGKSNKEYKRLEENQDWYGQNPFQVAVRHHHPEIVEILLQRKVQFDSFCASDYFALHKAFERPLCYRSRDRERVMEILLRTNISNINAIDKDSRTPLHCAVSTCGLYRHEEITERVHSADNIVEMLLNNGANLNQSDCFGQTALMLAAERGCDHFAQTLLDWSRKNENNLLLDLRDNRGRTALMRAVVNRNVNLVDLLIRNGASVNVHDNRGLTPLHAAIYETDLYWTDVKYFCSQIRTHEFDSSDFDDDFNDIDRMIKDLDYKEARKKQVKENVIRIILNSDSSDVNAVDFSGKTPLDLALQFSDRISSATKNALETHRSVKNKTKHQGESISNNMIAKCQFLVIDKLGRTPLHRAAMILQRTCSPVGFDEWYKLLPKVLNIALKNNNYLAKTADYKGRTAVHYAVMLNSAYEFDDRVAILLTMLLDNGVNVNEADIYGRTPLHYAEEIELYSFLIEKGASERTHDMYMLNAPQNFRELLYPIEPIWQIRPNSSDRLKFNKSSSLHVITKEIQRLVDRISAAIGERDRRFTCRPTLVGSSSDGTKIDIPGDFDFDLTLTELSKRCEIFPCPATPSGYVQLKRNILDRGEVNYFCKSEDGFDAFFNREKLLLVNEVNQRFKQILNDILHDTHFWINEDIFELHRSFYIDENDTVNDEDPIRLYNNVKLTMIHPIHDEEGELYFSELPLDLVPCIHIQNWWPDEALHSAKDEYKSLGFNVVFDPPQRFHPWVPFAETYGRIAFSQAESHVIKNCSRVSIAAFRKARITVKSNRHAFQDLESPYTLRSSFLYCIEALDIPKSGEVSDELCEIFDPKEIDLWVERILFCFAEFFYQDFLPCYFMPSFSLPIKGQVKSGHDRQFLLGDLDKEYVTNHPALYREYFPDSSETEFSNNFTVQPLREHFDRETFIRKLHNFNRHDKCSQFKN